MPLISEYVQQGAQYHWKTELNRRLKLPVYDGVEEKLQKQNQKRKRALDAIKTEENTRKSKWQENHVGNKTHSNAFCAWSRQHGQDTYGEATKVEKKESKATASTKRSCKKCGSNTHSLPTLHLCPHKKPDSTQSSTKMLTRGGSRISARGCLGV